VKRLFENAHPFLQLLIFLFITLVALTFIMILGIVVAIPIFDLSLTNLGAIMSQTGNPEFINFMKFLQTLQGIGLFTVPPLLAAYLFAPSVKEYLGMQAPNANSSFVLVILIMLLAMPLINLIAYFNANIDLPASMDSLESYLKVKEESAQQLIEAFLNVSTLGGLLFNIFLIGVLPAIGEELAFRGILQRLFTNWSRNPHVGIIVAAFLFSAMHMQFYGFIPRFLLGMLFGYLYYWSGSIWMPILAHFVNNTTAVLAYFFMGGEMVEQMDNMGVTTQTIIAAVIGAVLFSWTVYYFWKREKGAVIN
jgi:membrane protease YdiL (CAAX protease family)